MSVILGLIFEHQGPEAKVKLDPTKARKKFKMQGRSDARIEAFLKVLRYSFAELFEFLTLNLLCCGIYILYKSKSKSSIFNYNLSETDINFIMMLNPNGFTVNHSYKGVRIGEYNWINNNFYTEVSCDWNIPLIGWESEYSMIQARLDKYLPCCFLNPAKYQINMSDFNRYYGIYYKRATFNYMINRGKMYENEIITCCELSSYVDYRQLFAIYPMDYPDTRLDVYVVTRSLTAYTGANSLVFNIWSDDGSGYVVDFFRDRNTMPYANVYNFNAMIGGARLYGNGIWKNGYGPLPGCVW